MSSSNLKSPKENIASIPIYFSNHLPSKKDILIGKVQLQDKNNYKVVPIKSENQGTKTIKSESQLIKEYTLLSDSNKFVQYTGRENIQDSNYVLMKYNSKSKEIQMYPANNWVNFFKSMKKPEKKEELDLKAKDKILKDQIKEKNRISKNFFNFENEFYEGEDKKKKRPKKKGLLANNEDDEESKGSNKKVLPEFKEDSHSSEIEAELGYDSFESDDEKKKKEEKKRKEEEKKKQEKKEVEQEEEEDEESEDDKDIDSDVSKDEGFNQVNEYFNLIGKKRERENNPSYELEERLENILRKKNRMTEEEIIVELKKVCKMEDIEKYFEIVLDNITNNFTDDDGEKYYYLKK